MKLLGTALSMGAAPKAIEEERAHLADLENETVRYLMSLGLAGKSGSHIDWLTLDNQ